MAVQITSDNFEQYFLRTQEQFADALEQAEGARGCEVVTDIETIKQVLSLPGVKYSADPITTPTATAQAYVQIPYSILAQALQEMREATEDATEAAGSAETAITNAEAATSAANTAAQSADTSRQQIEANESTRQSNESTRQSNESTRQSNEQSRTSTFSSDHGRAESDHSQAVSDHGTASSDHTQAGTDHSTATSDHTQAVSDHEKVAGAENLDAQLVGMTVTITNRQGIATSVNIGFEITPEHVYASKAAMLADAANIQAGQFCMIASTDATDPDNATLWSRNSQPATSASPFTFLSDLDQASAAAWADWLENMKPAINERIETADADHGRAVSDHSTASGDHTQAGQDHSQAQSDHSTATADHTQAGQDHTQAQDDHSTASADHQQAVTDSETASDDHDTAEQDHAESTAATSLANEKAAYADEMATLLRDETYIEDDGYWRVLGVKTNNYARGNADWPTFSIDAATGDVIVDATTDVTGRYEVLENGDLVVNY